MQQTNQYKLNLIESGDTFSAQPINENMEKVETALGELATNGVKIATGLYKGTNTYGSSNKKTLVFEFEPKLIIVSNGTQAGFFVAGNSNAMVVYAHRSDGTNFSAYGWGLSMSVSGNTLTWYSTTNEVAQLNSSSCTYRYIVIG